MTGADSAGSTVVGGPVFGGGSVAALTTRLSVTALGTPGTAARSVAAPTAECGLGRTVPIGSWSSLTVEAEPFAARTSTMTGARADVIATARAMRRNVETRSVLERWCRSRWELAKLLEPVTGGLADMVSSSSDRETLASRNSLRHLTLDASWKYHWRCNLCQQDLWVLAF